MSPRFGDPMYADEHWFYIGDRRLPHVMREHEDFDVSGITAMAYPDGVWRTRIVHLAFECGATLSVAWGDDTQSVNLLQYRIDEGTAFDERPILAEVAMWATIGDEDTGLIGPMGADAYDINMLIDLLNAGKVAEAMRVLEDGF